MLENKNYDLRQCFYNKFFFYFLCAIIFILSIFLRSISDIGADTGVYLDLGKKVFLGKKYYYDFFESNFPLSFYFYALQYWISLKTHIGQIILSEIFINLLALLSIFWSAKILQKSIISENKAHYHLILISYFLGFFLRPEALQIGEFGTKTSLLLILLYPYISFSFPPILPLNKLNLFYRGMLMGLMPCLKIHYLILILPIEIYRFLQSKSSKFFFELDKLTMALVGSLGLFLMIKFTPEYFEFIPPMWKNVYKAYDDPKIFLDNLWNRSATILQFALIFLIFARVKFSEINKILTIFFVSAALLIILENIGTIDQTVVFYAVATICFVKFIFDLLQEQKSIIFDNLFIVSVVIFLPIFDMKVLPAAFLGLGGVINLWWLLYWYYFANSAAICGRFLILYFLLLTFVLGVFYLFEPWAALVANLSSILLMLFIFERKRLDSKFSSFSVFVIFAAISTLVYCYISSVSEAITRENKYSLPNEFSKAVIYYNKKYAPNPDDGFLMNSFLILDQFPSINYLEKDNLQKFHVSIMQANQGLAGSRMMFNIKNPDEIFTNYYLFDDVRNAVNNPKIKIIFFNNSPELINKKDRCLISTLEYYLLDHFFRKNFLQKFRFENHVIISKSSSRVKKNNFFSRNNSDVFDQIAPSKKQIFYDFEVYVRK